MWLRQWQGIRRIQTLVGVVHGFPTSMKEWRRQSWACGTACTHAWRLCASACRLTFWWSNVLQLRWCFWTLCQNQALGYASSLGSGGNGDGAGGGAWPSGAGLAAGRSGRLGNAERQGSDQLSPRTAAAAATGRSSSLHGQDWMQARRLHGWPLAASGARPAHAAGGTTVALRCCRFQTPANLECGTKGSPF